MSTEVLGDMLVRYKADISDLTKNVKQAKSDMSSMAEATDKSTKQMTSSFKNTSNEAEKTMGNLKHTLSNTLSFVAGQTIFAGIGAGFNYIKEQIGGVFQESMDAADELAQTNQVLKSTHDASGMTSTAILDLASNFSHLTKFTDDQTQIGENLLLTFTNIGKNIFPQTTKTMLDLSQAMGQDVKESAVQLGKALNDPLTGMSALQRVGVTFNQTQKDLIKGYMDHGQLAKAQIIILQELQKEFGGSAEAAGKTLGGQMAILRQRVDDVKQSIGDALTPIAIQFFGYISSQFMPRLNDFSTWFQKDGIPLIVQFGDWFQKQGIPAIMNFGQEILQVATVGVHFVQWLHDGTPPAQALTFAALALGGAILAIKLGNVVSDMKDFITSTPQLIAKMLLVQESAEGVAGAKGLGAITSEAKNAETAMATAASGMKLSLAGIIGGVASVALLEFLAAKWLRDNNIVPTVKAAGGGIDVNPNWVTHHNPDDDIKKAAQDAKDLQANIDQAWKDMEALGDWAQKHKRILGDVLDPISITPADVKVQELKSHLDDLTKPLVLPSMKPFTADVIAARQKVIDLKSHIDDLKGPITINVGVRTVDAAIAKVMYLKSQLDDSSSSSSGGVPHLAGGGFIQSSGLAFVHAGETVVPASSSAQVNSSGGTIGQGQTFIWEVDGVVLAQIVNKSSDRLVRLKLGAAGRAA